MVSRSLPSGVNLRMVWSPSSVQYKPRHDLLYASASLSRLDMPGANPCLAAPVFSPTLGPCTTSCSVLEHRRVPHTSADGQRGLPSTSFRHSGVLQRARAAPPATDLPL